MYAGPDPGVYGQQQMFDQTYQAYPSMAQQQVSYIRRHVAVKLTRSLVVCQPERA
jgi:hypothetical protein